jgi:hypothetical protein
MGVVKGAAWPCRSSPECTQRVASALAFLFIRNPFESISPAREIRL